MRSRATGGAVLGAVLAGLVATPGAAAAQERGWLGINMTQYYECVWETNTDWKTCDLVMNVEGVQPDGPAASAGIRPGDQMVALNGQDLTFESVHRLIDSIRPGAPVSVDFMRDGVRRYVHVTPSTRPANPEAIAWTGRPTGQAQRVLLRQDRPRTFVVTLTDPDETQGAFAITIRDVDDADVAVEPATLRVVDGQLRLMQLDASDLVEQQPALRDQLLVDLRLIQDSTYRKASDALRVLASIRQRLPGDDFRRRLARVARAGMDEARFGEWLNNSLAGAEFEVATGALANAVAAGREGLLVMRVVSGTPAARSGLRPGDVLFEAGGRPIREVSDLRQAIDESGGTVEVKWTRKGVEHQGRLPGQ